jgi:hypothetical protein
MVVQPPRSQPACSIDDLRAPELFALYYSEAQKKSVCVISVTSQPKLNRYLVRLWTSEGQPAWWDSRWA